MRLTNKIVALLLLPLLFLSSPSFAQQTSVVDSAAMSQALANKADVELAQRELVRRVLERDDVRELAARMGLKVADAQSAVATLSGAQLNALAQQAAAVDAATLAGGSNTIVISVTTLLLILIIVILLVK